MNLDSPRLMLLHPLSESRVVRGRVVACVHRSDLLTLENTKSIPNKKDDAHVSSASGGVVRHYEDALSEERNAQRWPREVQAESAGFLIILQRGQLLGLCGQSLDWILPCIGPLRVLGNTRSRPFAYTAPVSNHGLSTPRTRPIVVSLK
jgi:hypothetical protein